MVQGEGFEPPKAEPDDLQSPVFDRFTNPAKTLRQTYGFSQRAVSWNESADSGCSFPLGHRGHNCEFGAACRIRTDDIQFTKLTL